MLSVANLAAGLGDGLEHVIGQQPHFVVGDGCTQLHDGQPFDEAGILAQAELADGEILQTAHGLHAVQYVFGNLHTAEQVALGTCLQDFFFHYRNDFTVYFLFWISNNPFNTTESYDLFSNKERLRDKNRPNDRKSGPR